MRTQVQQTKALGQATRMTLVHLSLKRVYLRIKLRSDRTELGS